MRWRAGQQQASAVVGDRGRALAPGPGPRRLRRRRSAAAATASEVTTAKGGPVKGELTISNWPGYIDPGPDGTVAEFENETGVSVNYIEDVNDNDDFFGKLQPQLEQGESGGRSIFVVTDWMAKQMYDLGYLQEIDPDDLPTVFENMVAEPARAPPSTRGANSRSPGRAG